MSEELKKYRDDHSDFDKNIVVRSFEDPFHQFSAWFDHAVESKVLEANAMVVSTVSKENIPTSRIVYLKEMDEKGFVFYTNYQSEKGQHLEANGQASLLFFWPELQQQIQIRGKVQKISESQSDTYFDSRPRSSQLGAWASEQSKVLKSEEELQERLKLLANQFKDKVQRPPHWGGYQLIPFYFEFWQGKPSRLHHREVFEKTSDGWSKFLKNP